MSNPRYYWIRFGTGPAVDVRSEPIDEPMPVLLERLSGVSAKSPEIVRLAGEIADCGGGADLVALVDRREVRRREDWAAAAHAYRAAPGTVLCATSSPEAPTHRRGYVEAMMLLAGEQRAGDARLAFQHVRRNATLSDTSALLARYGLEQARSAVSGEETFQSEITLSIPAAFLDIWFDAPPQRTNRFFHAYSRVAMALQEVFRRWLRYEWLADLRRCEDHGTARAAIVYWMSPPRGASSRAEFVYDVMAPQTLDRLCRGAKRLGAEFADVAARLEAAGLDNYWYSGNLKKIVGPVRREERSLRRLLAMDSDVLDHLIGLGVNARLMREGTPVDPDVSVPHPIDLICDFAHGLRSHLRRGPISEWSPHLASLVMIEATNAMRGELGLDHGIRAELRITTEDGRQLEFRADDALLARAGESVPGDDSSTENLEEADALPS